MVNKKKMISRIAEKTGLSKKDAEKALDAFVETIKDTLAAGDKVSLIGFGTFEKIERKARDARNPQTGEILHLDSVNIPKFKSGKGLKDAVNE